MTGFVYPEKQCRFVVEEKSITRVIQEMQSYFIRILFMHIRKTQSDKERNLNNIILYIYFKVKYFKHSRHHQAYMQVRSITA